MAFPDYNQTLMEFWGWGNEGPGLLSSLTLASNILIGTNPPYSAADFFAWFPAFGGTPANPLGTIDGISEVVSDVSDLTGLAAGQLIAGTGIASGSVIVANDENAKTLTLSQNTTLAGTNIQLTIYINPAVPLPVLNAYIWLATNSIMQVRYQEMWPFCMALYIAHYVTMWLQGQTAGPGSTPAQVASAGLAMGIRTSKAVGDVSVGMSPISKFDDWGTYALTSYGQQLAMFAMALGSGNMLLW
jgi:hypothetical protein